MVVELISLSESALQSVTLGFAVADNIVRIVAAFVVVVAVSSLVRILLWYDSDFKRIYIYTYFSLYIFIPNPPELNTQQRSLLAGSLCRC